MSLKPEHLRRYRQIAALLLKYGRSDLVRQFQLEEVTVEAPEVPPDARHDASELAKDLEKLGPTFIKLGQMLSTRSDLLPGPYLEALARLQDRVAPFPFSEVESIVRSELEKPITNSIPDRSCTARNAPKISTCIRPGVSSSLSTIRFWPNPNMISALMRSPMRSNR